jgi:RimJ/RimL family protein N-acetyltransferase
MRLLFDKKPIIDWWNERQETKAGEGTHSAIGIVDPETGQIIGAVVYHAYKGHDVELGIATEDPRWAQKGTLRAIFDYAFNQLGCARCTAITGKQNRPARDLLERLGFKREGTHRNGMAPGVTAISYGMQKDECRWL